MNGNQDLSGIIGKLTENPEMMKSLMGIAGKLMNGDGGQNKGNTDLDGNNYPTNNDKQPFSQPQKREEDCNDSRFDRQCSDRDCTDSHHKDGRGNDAENLIRLLIALKPYVGKDRCEKIDGIVKILKLVQLSEKTGLLKSLL